MLVGVAEVDECGLLDVEAHHTSRRPQEFRMSSIRTSVSSSEDVLYGYPITLVLGYCLLTEAASSV